MIAYILFLVTAFAGILHVEFLDVGQGDAILIQTPAGKTVMIDGGTGKKHDVSQYLQERGITEINLLVGTHAHADHIGGLDDVIETVNVKLYMDNGMPHTTRTYNSLMDLIERKNIKYITAKAGRKFNLDDGITLEIISPYDKLLSSTRSDLNSNSVVMRLTHGKNCFLFTGDAEEPTEDLLVRKGIEPCNVLKVAHHGSNHSSTNHFLEKVTPQHAVISLGKNNRYNHPGDETVKRLERVGAKIYRTDELGTIKASSDKKTVSFSFVKTPPTTGKKKTTKDTPKKSDVTQNIEQNEKGFNLNTATLEQLKSIPGIGPSKAKAIIQYREQNGPFSTIQQVKQVYGIGDKLTTKIAQHSYVE